MSSSSPQPTILLAQYGGAEAGKTLSPACGKVQMALRFKGLEFELRNCITPGEVKRYNPRGRMPALVVDDEPLVDSSDILDELDRRWPEPPLLPDEVRERARCRLVEDWADEVLYFYGVWTRWEDEAGFRAMKAAVFDSLPIPMRWLAPRFARRELRARARLQGTALKPAAVVRRELRAGLEMLEDLLGQDDWFCGGRLTRADLALASLIDQFGVPWTAPANRIDFEGLPRLGAWLERVHERVPNAAG